jgi:hypothetical protein
MAAKKKKMTLKQKPAKYVEKAVTFFLDQIEQKL